MDHSMYSTITPDILSGDCNRLNAKKQNSNLQGMQKNLLHDYEMN